MRIAARITYDQLCKQLAVEAIPGIVDAHGKAVDRAGTVVRLRAVVVSDDDAIAALKERDCWENEPVLADDAEALVDFIGALRAGDIGLARILSDRVFEDERMRLACDAALQPARRVA